MSCSAQKNNYDLILRELDENYQLKIDKGEFMLETERDYALKMDSLMKVVFNNLIELKTDNRENLEIEQNEWDLQNKINIKNIWEPLNEVMDELVFIPNDEKMFAYNEQALFTLKRDLDLIYKFNNYKTKQKTQYNLCLHLNT